MLTIFDSFFAHPHQDVEDLIGQVELVFTVKLLSATDVRYRPFYPPEVWAINFPQVYQHFLSERYYSPIVEHHMIVDARLLFFYDLK